MPRFLPPPTGHPSEPTAEVIAQLHGKADAEHADGEAWLTTIRDLHHVFDAAYTAWEVAVARAAGDPAHGATIRDIADVCDMDYGVIRDRAAKGRERLPAKEREELEAGMRQRRGRGPRAE